MGILFQIGRFIMAFGGFTAATGIAQCYRELVDWGEFAGLERVVFGFILGMGGMYLRGLGLKEEQRERDDEAAYFHVSKPEKDFILYLRPFISTGKLMLKNPYHNPWGMGIDRLGEDEFVDFESIMARSFDKKISFYALGRPGEHIGAGRILTSDDEWWSEFTDMATKSTVIFMLPGYQKGVLSEIEWLFKNGYTSKCIFIMPTDVSDIGEDIGEYWHETQMKLQTIGINLPDILPNGSLFFYSDSKAYVYTELKYLESDVFEIIFNFFKENNTDKLLEIIRNVK